MSTTTVKTEVGSYFITNYPPYSQWTKEGLAEVQSALHSPPRPDVPLNLYLHIPFCRKRCKFCYFRVYTDKNSHEVEDYVAALSREIELLSHLPVLGGRPLRCVYFGGGTPSFLSAKQLTSLMNRLRANIQWDKSEEVTFECEPGTLSESKVRTLKELGVTRISLGVENWDDQILETNGRAHLSAEIQRAWDWIVATKFPNTNIDLIAGMVGETWEKWRETVRRTLDCQPDSVTIYQMELPFNTVFSQDILGQQVETPVADWPTKRAWVDCAFDQFLSAGYSISSGYTVVRDKSKVNFSYRDNLFSGADLLATGVASFGHISGVHYQNLHDWTTYIEPLQRGELPLGRGLKPTAHQLLIREVILSLKTGRLDAAYFRRKYQTDILKEWSHVWAEYQQLQMLTVAGDDIQLTRAGLLQVDGLLPAFFEQAYQGVRYT